MASASAIFDALFTGSAIILGLWARTTRGTQAAPMPGAMPQPESQQQAPEAQATPQPEPEPQPAPAPAPSPASEPTVAEAPTPAPQQGTSESESTPVSEADHMPTASPPVASPQDLVDETNKKAAAQKRQRRAATAAAARFSTSTPRKPRDWVKYSHFKKQRKTAIYVPQYTELYQSRHAPKPGMQDFEAKLPPNKKHIVPTSELTARIGMDMAYATPLSDGLTEELCAEMRELSVRTKKTSGVSPLSAIAQTTVSPADKPNVKDQIDSQADLTPTTDATVDVQPTNKLSPERVAGDVEPPEGENASAPQNDGDEDSPQPAVEAHDHNEDMVDADLPETEPLSSLGAAGAQQDDVKDTSMSEAAPPAVSPRPESEDQTMSEPQPVMSGADSSPNMEYELEPAAAPTDAPPQPMDYEQDDDTESSDEDEPMPDRSEAVPRNFLEELSARQAGRVDSPFTIRPDQRTMATPLVAPPSVFPVPSYSPMMGVVNSYKPVSPFANGIPSNPYTHTSPYTPGYPSAASMTQYNPPMPARPFAMSPIPQAQPYKPAAPQYKPNMPSGPPPASHSPTDQDDIAVRIFDNARKAQSKPDDSLSPSVAEAQGHAKRGTAPGNGPASIPDTPTTVGSDGAVQRSRSPSPAGSSPQAVVSSMQGKRDRDEEDEDEDEEHEHANDSVLDETIVVTTKRPHLDGQPTDGSNEIRYEEDWKIGRDKDESRTAYRNIEANSTARKHTSDDDTKEDAADQTAKKPKVEIDSDVSPNEIGLTVGGSLIDPNIPLSEKLVIFGKVFDDVCEHIAAWKTMKPTSFQQMLAETYCADIKVVGKMMDALAGFFVAARAEETDANVTYSSHIAPFLYELGGQMKIREVLYEVSERKQVIGEQKEALQRLRKMFRPLVKGADDMKTESWRPKGDHSPMYFRFDVARLVRGPSRS